MDKTELRLALRELLTDAQEADNLDSMVCPSCRDGRIRGSVKTLIVDSESRIMVAAKCDSCKRQFEYTVTEKDWREQQ